MADTKIKRLFRNRPRLAAGLVVSFSFLAVLIALGIFYPYFYTNSSNIATIAKSSYSNDGGSMLSSRGKSLSVLSLTDSQLLDDIDARISASVENTEIEAKEEQAQETTAATAAVQETTAASSGTIESVFASMENNIRASQGLQTLIVNPVLSSIARSRCQDMLNRGYFSHTTPEGKNIGMILQENGIMYACSAENLGQASPPSWGSPEAIINLWMSSGLHRANLLNPNFGQTGIGIVDSGGRRIIVQIFINR